MPHLQNPKFSIVIPTYNRKYMIGDAIESVLSQSYQDYEIIVVDDASTDGTSDWIKDNYPSIKTIVLTNNQGASSARNIGVSAARGEYIAFLDSDDEWFSDFLMEHDNALAKNDQAAFSFNDCNLLLVNGPSQHYEIENVDLSDPISRLLRKNFIPTMSAVVTRRTLLLEAGLMNTNLKICHDRELYLRLLLIQEGVIHIPHKLTTKRLHEKNISSNYRQWAKETNELLTCFFAQKGSENYNEIEYTARIAWYKFIAKIAFKSSKNIFVVIELFVRAFIVRIKYLFA